MLLDNEKTAIVIALGAVNFESIVEIDKMYTSAGFRYIYWSAEEFVRAHFSERTMKSIYNRETTSIVINTQVGCSINCKWCPQDVFLKRYASLHAPWKLTLENYKRALKRIPSEVYITFSGYAEPFLNHECPDMMIETKRQGRYMGLFSTLVGLDVAGFERLSKIDIDDICLHLPDAEGHAKITVNSEYLEILKLFIERFSESLKPDRWAPRISIHGTLHPKVCDLFEKMGFDYRIGAYTCKANDRAGHLVMSDVPATGYKGGKLFCANGRPWLAIRKNTHYNMDDLILSRESRSLQMLPNFDIVPCCNVWEMEHILGNLLADDPEMVMSNNWRTFLKGLDDESVSSLCRRCASATRLDTRVLVTRDYFISE